MRIQRGSTSGDPSFPLTRHFQGNAWMDMLLQAQVGQEAGDLVVASVTFAPGARTDWHRHEGGQILYVLAGHGWVGGRPDECHDIFAGDLVWTPGGEDHWHGATDETSMVHLSVTLGTTFWQGAVATPGPASTSPDVPRSD